MATSKKPLPLLVRAKETTPPSVQTGGRLISDVTSMGAVKDGTLFILEDPDDGMAYKGTFLKLKAQIAKKAYGIIYTSDGQAQSPLVQQSVNGTPALYTGWTSNGLSNDTTPEHDNDWVIVSVAGVYEVNISICFSGSLSKTYEVEIYHNDISASPVPTATGFKLTRKLGTSGDVGSASLTGLLDLAVNDSVAIYVSSTDGGTAFETHQAQMQVAQV